LEQKIQNLGTNITKIWEIKLQKYGNKKLKKIWEQKSRNKNSKNQGIKVIKIREQKSRNKNYKNLGTNYKNLGIKNYKNTGTKITKIWQQK
jgi:hypothetical protein